MPVAEVLEQLGGVATRIVLVATTSRPEVDAALAAGEVVALARGRYALPSADAAVAAAHALCGVVSHTSAALRHGWPVLHDPVLPHVTVARNRVLSEEQVSTVSLHRTHLGPDDVAGTVTSRDRTLLDCLRGEPFLDALAVADSALRDGVSPARLRAIARDARGPGSVQARRVAALADDRAANPFESALRGIASQVPGLHVVPQVSVRDGSRFLGRPDLVDERLGIILEADSFEWHGRRLALARDARRYNRFVVAGWLVLRFAWEDVVLDPDSVRVVLELGVAERTERCSCRRSPA